MENWNLIFEKVKRVFEENDLNHLPYHNWQHTLRVIEKAEEIALQENVNEANLRLLKTAALYHDIGFVYGPFNHEESSVNIAIKDLSGFGYKEDEIQLICGMIRATSIPQNPKNHLENILADADLEYLGTDEYDEISDNLFRELMQFSPNLSTKKWIELQISFLKMHHYHTAFCKENRKSKKAENLQKIIDSNT